jgi:hypothetical protein
VLAKHVDDPRALFLCWLVSSDDGVHELLARASEMATRPRRHAWRCGAKEETRSSLRNVPRMLVTWMACSISGCSFSWAAGAIRTLRKRWTVFKQRTSAVLLPRNGSR